MKFDMAAFRAKMNTDLENDEFFDLIDAYVLLKPFIVGHETNDGWIEYDGKGQPVPDDTIVQTIVARETKEKFDKHSSVAQYWDWGCRDDGYAIKFYRVLKS